MSKNIVDTLRGTKIHIYTPKREDKHPHNFHMGVPPPPSQPWDELAGQRSMVVVGIYR